MKTMQELVTEIGSGEVTVTDVQVVKTDMGNILDISLWSMDHPDVLSMNIRLPEEVLDKYNLQEFGRKIQDGFKKLGDHLRDQSED